MKFVSLFAAGAVASLVPRAEVDTIKSDIQTIRDAVQSFTSTLSDYSEDDIDTVRSDLRAIILAINAADSDTKALKGPFSDRDATALATPIQDLGIDFGKATDALLAKKSALVAKCHGPEIYQALTDQSMQSDAFQKDLMKRLSPDVQNLATQMAKPFNSNLAKGVAAFWDQQNVKCAAPKYTSTSSIYGAVPVPTGSSSSSSSPSSGSSASPSPASSNSDNSQTNSNTNTGLLSSPNSGSSDNTNADTANPNKATNSTSATYTAGPAPTASILSGSASSIGASLAFACVAGLAVFAL